MIEKSFLKVDFNIFGFLTMVPHEFYRLKASKSCPNVREQQSVKPAANAKSIPRPQPTLKLKPPTNGTKDKKSAKKDLVKDDGLYDSVELSFMGRFCNKQIFTQLQLICGI